MNRIGDRVGPFQLESLLVEGDDVSLYRAVRPEGSKEPRVVAIRMANQAHDTDSAAVIRTEYEVLRHLNDTRIPRTHGHYSTQRALSLSHFEGIKLSQIVRLWREDQLDVDVATAIDILLEIAQALRAAHNTRREGVPIIHGHLSTTNITLTGSGRIVVHGFGSRPRGTMAAFTPPEQAAAAFIDGRSDQWALGSVGVELLLGERLYTGVDNRRDAAMNGDVGEWIGKLEGRFPAASRVIGRMLAPAAGDRYASSGELVADLLALSRQCAGPADRPKLAATAWQLLFADEEPPPTVPDAAREDPAPPHTPPEPDEAPVPEPIPAEVEAPVAEAMEEQPTVAMVSVEETTYDDPSEAPTVAITPEPEASSSTPEPEASSSTPVVVSAAPMNTTPDPGPRIELSKAVSEPLGPAIVAPPTADELEPTEMMSSEEEPAKPIEPADSGSSPPTEAQQVAAPPKNIDEALKELEQAELKAFVSVGVLILVAIIFLAFQFG